jgi:hypothetical protein
MCSDDGTFHTYLVLSTLHERGTTKESCGEKPVDAPTSTLTSIEPPTPPFDQHPGRRHSVSARPGSRKHEPQRGSKCALELGEAHY